MSVFLVAEVALAALVTAPPAPVDEHDTLTPPACFTHNITTYACPVGTCFCGPVWAEDELLNQTQTYSTKYDLALRLFAPPATGPRRDNRTKRPAIVGIHGGHFEGGDFDEAGLVAWCIRWARAGYVAASINYRLTWKQYGHPGDIMHALWDARAAVRWLRANAPRLGIDTERIGIFGDSAGGMVAAYVTAVGGGEGDSGSPGYSSAVRAVASLSGALWPPPPNASNVSAREPAYLDFHGCEDQFVPYDCDGKPACTWSAVGTNRRMRAAGARAGLVSFAGAGHVPWSDLDANRSVETMLGFLVREMDLAHAQCPTVGRPERGPRRRV